MRIGDHGYPVVILSHRGKSFIERTVASLRMNSHGITDVVVVDDSGDDNHHDWLCDQGYQFSVVDPLGNAGYLNAMTRVFEVAGELADNAQVGHALLWEEDFILTRGLSIYDMVTVMESHRADEANDYRALAQLNLQRQAVYRIERQVGYMESHQRRGYRLARQRTAGLDWVSRRKPFTTNPGLIRRDVLDISWPTREEADVVLGGAEPAMSLKLEAEGWYFGWFGKWNSRHTLHVGTEKKTGVGY